MYGGGMKRADGSMVGWRQIEAFEPEAMPHRFSVRQDIKLLDVNIVRTMGDALLQVVQKHRLHPDQVDWFLPHYSSAYFRPKFYDEMKRIGFEVPESKWVSNLSEKGNTGSAAIFIILEELFHSGQAPARPEPALLHSRKRAVFPRVRLAHGRGIEQRETTSPAYLPMTIMPQSPVSPCFKQAIRGFSWNARPPSNCGSDMLRSCSVLSRSSAAATSMLMLVGKFP